METNQWTYRRVTLEEANKEGLNNTNHLISKPQDDTDFLNQIYGAVPSKGPVAKRNGEVTISDWGEKPTMEIGPIIVYEKGDQKYWEPFIEHMIKLNILKEKEITRFRFGYINGRSHFLGPMPSSKLHTSGRMLKGYTFFYDID